MQTDSLQDVIQLTVDSILSLLRDWMAKTQKIIHFNLEIRIPPPLLSTRQHPSYSDCLEDKREYYQKSSVLDCVTQCSQSAAHLCEQLQVQQIGLVTLGPLRCA